MEIHSHKITAIMLSALLLSSCSSDDEATATYNANSEIGFNVTVNNPKGTRAIPTTAANYLSQVTDFKVWGYFTGGTEYYLGRTGNAGIYITHTSGKSDWNYKTATDVALWPKTALNFYAVTPSDNDNYTFNGQTLSYTVPTDQSKQVDMMVAKADNQLKTTNNGKVALAFQHQLSQVIFKGIISNSGMIVEVRNIVIHNVSSNIFVSLGGGTRTPTSPTNKTYSDYSVNLSSEKIVNSSTDATMLTDDNGVLMLVPQALTPWSTTSTTPVSITDADRNHQSYLEIECKIQSNGTYFVGSSSDYGKCYIPIGDTWEAGKRYVYTLGFGCGKDENGNDLGRAPIRFYVFVDDNWREYPSK